MTHPWPGAQGCAVKSGFSEQGGNGGREDSQPCGLVFLHCRKGRWSMGRLKVPGGEQLHLGTQGRGTGDCSGPQVLVHLSCVLPLTAILP